MLGDLQSDLDSGVVALVRSEEHTSELQSLSEIAYAAVTASPSGPPF